MQHESYPPRVIDWIALGQSISCNVLFIACLLGTQYFDEGTQIRMLLTASSFWIVSICMGVYSALRHGVNKIQFLAMLLNVLAMCIVSLWSETRGTY